MTTQEPLQIRRGIEGLIDVLISTLDYNTGKSGFKALDSSTVTTGEGRFYCLMAKNDDVVIKSTTTLLDQSGDAFPSDITLNPGQPPIYGNFKEVIIDAASAGVLLVYIRPEGI